MKRFEFITSKSQTRLCDTYASLQTYVSLGVGQGNPLQYSCLENRMDREA